MHFADWPVWARPKDEKPLTIEDIEREARTILYAEVPLPKPGEVIIGPSPVRKKPGPKPKAKP
jgi:hypothetical protein